MAWKDQSQRLAERLRVKLTVPLASATAWRSMLAGSRPSSVPLQVPLFTVEVPSNRPIATQVGPRSARVMREVLLESEDQETAPLLSSTEKPSVWISCTHVQRWRKDTRHGCKDSATPIWIFRDFDVGRIRLTGRYRATHSFKISM